MAQSKRKKDGSEVGDIVRGLLEDVAAKGKSLLGGGLEEAKEIFGEKMELIGEKADELKDKKVGEIAEEVKRFVKENPWTSVAIAVGLGFVLRSVLKSDD